MGPPEAAPETRKERPVPRGNKGWKRKKLLWASKKANRGRKGAYGKQPKFMGWAEVKAKIRRNATTIVVPPKDAAAEPADKSH